MDNYEELIEQINRGEYIIFKADNPQVYQVTRFNRQIADAIEQLVRERDTAVKNMETATPAVDAEPVKHGHWIYDHWCEFKCSNCGEWSNSKPYRGREKYCPNCGAKMDEKGSEERDDRT